MPPKKSTQNKLSKNDIENEELPEEDDIDEDTLDNEEDIDEDTLDNDDIDDEYDSSEENEDDGEDFNEYDSDNEYKTNENKDENCVYDYIENDEYDDTQDDIIEEVDEIKNTLETIVPPEDRITKSSMTSYERVRILGTRAKQLAGGAKPLIAGVENMNSFEVAKLELMHKVMPIIIRRELPNGNIEEWKISELSIN